MLRKIVNVFSVSTIGKILGFIKIQLLTTHFGANAYTDAIIIVMNIYWFWSNEIVFSLFSNTLIPKLAKSEVRKKQVLETLKILCSANLLTVFFLFCAIFIGKWVIFLFAPMASDEFFDHGVLLMLVLSPLAILIPITEIFTLHNQYREKYGISSINMIVWNSFQIIAILIAQYFLSPLLLIYLFGGLTIVGYVITTYLQLSASDFFKYFQLRHIFNISYKNFKLNVIENSKFFISTVLIQTNVYINYAFISKLSKGSITTYDIILKVPYVFQSLLMSTLSIIFFNAISNENHRASEYFWKFTKGMFALILPIAIVANFFGLDLLYLIYSKNVFIGRDGVLIVLFVGFINIYFMGKLSLLVKTIIVNEKGNFLLISTIFATLLNAILNYFAVDYYGLAGVITTTLLVNILLTLALQTSIFIGDKNYKKFIALDLFVIFFSILLYRYF
jgi:peptidoglycan biosynthesis protein MviN/MurJ (putative lipid II flippase)